MPRRLLAAGVGLLLVLVLATGRVERTEAAWTGTDAASASFTSARGVLAPTALQCVPRTGALTAAITLQWTAPTDVPGYVTPQTYEVQILTGLGTVVYDQYVTMPSTVIVGGLLALGSYTIQVRGVTNDHSWASAWITDPVTVASVIGYRCAT